MHFDAQREPLGVVISDDRHDLLRGHYLDAAIPAISRILASVDRNPFGPSYGCCDRQYWHYRTAAFPSEMYQEAALPLALAYTRPYPGSDWFGEARLAETAIAILRFSARSAHDDGSCDDYYPNERALGAAVFSLQAATETYRLLGLDDAELLRFFVRRAEWIAKHDESGRLTNHHALSALALWRTAKLTGRDDLRQAAIERLERVLAWQSPEGWFPEYEGADPGYQTVTVDCLAKFHAEPGFEWLAEPLRRAVAFCRWFQHPDDSYAGCYGSRGTRHFYPHGMELLADDNTDAAALADGHLRALARGTAAGFDDDRMYVHRVANLLEAYDRRCERHVVGRRIAKSVGRQKSFHSAGLYVRRDAVSHTIVSTARGGVFRHSAGATTTVDAGLVVEFEDGRVAVSQTHDLSTAVEIFGIGDTEVIREITTTRMLDFVRFERATPLKQAALHLLMGALGKWGRTTIRQFLQRRVIAGGVSAPIRMKRTFEFANGEGFHDGSKRLRVTDVFELTDPKARVKRLAFASDLQAAYTAAAESYQHVLRQPWQDYSSRAEELNTARRLEIVREL
jgi:hypothetical protein